MARKKSRRPSLASSIRRSWATHFYLNGKPFLPCPTCGSGRLVPREKTFVTHETADSVADHEHPAWEDEYERRRFVGMLVCDAPHCGDWIAVCGDAGWEQDDEGEFSLKFEPTFLAPAPLMFALSDGWPSDVLTELRAAFGSFWHDLPASANHVRAAVEFLMTAKGVKRTQLTARRRRMRLSLHQRIELFKATDTELGEALLAIKWIGNAGSHGGFDSLTRNDLFDAFDLLAHVLPELLDGKSKALKRLAKGIVRKKGPVSGRRSPT